LIVPIAFVAVASGCSDATQNSRLLWSDSNATASATFQSHVDKVLVSDGKVYLAYTYPRDAQGFSNKVVTIDLVSGASSIATRDETSNSGCLVEMMGSVLHIYEDYIKKELHITWLGSETSYLIPAFQTAGKITCLARNESDVYVGNSYGQVSSLNFSPDGVPEVKLVREDFVLTPPEFGQYPHLAWRAGELHVFNNTIDTGWYYLDFIQSICAEGGCTEFKRLFPRDVVLANSWVGDVYVYVYVYVDEDGAIFVYFSENSYHFDSVELYKNPEANTGYVGVYRNEEWTKFRVGERVLSGKFVERDGGLTLISMTQNGEVTSHLVKADGLSEKGRQYINIVCAYALDAVFEGIDLVLAVTDRGEGCITEDNSGEAQIWLVKGL